MPTTIHRSAVFVAMLTAAALLPAAQAAPPFQPDLITGGNRWTITFYDDSSPNHQQWATQGICFFSAGTVGTQQRYYWVSDTYPDWNGRAAQEGDQVFMHGDFQWPFGTRDGGHDGMEWQLVTVSPKDVGTGHWKEWVEDGKLGITIGFGNTRLERVGKCAAVTHSMALESGAKLKAATPNPMGIPQREYEKKNQ